MAFAKVLPAKQYVVGIKSDCTIEQDNSNTYHYLGRMPRRSKIASCGEEMVSLSLRLSLVLTTLQICPIFRRPRSLWHDRVFQGAIPRFRKLGRPGGAMMAVARLFAMLRSL